MKRVVKRHDERDPRASGHAVEDAPVPPLLDDGVVVRVRRSLVSDLLSAAPGAPPQLWTAGESCAGTVVATGRAGDLPSVSARVACFGAAHAAHAEYVSMPRNLVVTVPGGLGWEEACFAGPGALAIEAVRRTEATLGEWVAIAGQGLVEMLAIQVARAWGLRPISLVTDAAGPGLARSLGAEAAIELGEKTREEVLRLTGGRGADRLVLASPKGTHHALRALRRKGRAVLLGPALRAPADGALERGEIELVLAGSPGPGFGDARYEEKGIDYPIAYVRWTESRNMAEALRLIAAKKIATRPLSGSVHALDDAPQVLANPGALPCAFLDYPEREDAPLDRLPEAPAPLAPQTRPRATAPLDRQAKVVCVVSGSSGTEKKALASERGFEIREVAESQASAEVARALDSGRHIVVLGPLATAREGLESVAAARSRRPDLLLAVLDERRHAPWARALRSQLEHRGGSAFFVCRSSGGPASLALLLGYLAGDPRPTALEASSAGGERPSRAFLLRYEDGAIASCVDPGTGPAGFRLEAWKGGACWAIEDGGALEAWGEGALGAPASDGAALARTVFDQVARALAGEPHELAPPEDALVAAETAILIEERLGRT